MIVLGIDTALGACSAALLRDGAVLARRFELMDRGHAERLFPMLSEISAEAGVALREADRIAVTVGPGSFTGTRVGLAAARGMALAARRPVVGVTTLAAVAAAAQDLPASCLIGVLFDARRGGFYGQIFDRERTALTEPFVAGADTLAMRCDLAGRMDFPLAVIGTGAEAGVAALTGRRGGVFLAQGNPLPDAAVVARLGSRLHAETAPPVPLYLRPPDAAPAGPPPMRR